MTQADRGAATSSLFKPHPLLWNGHLQTVFAPWFIGRCRPPLADHREVPLADGDQLTYLDSTPVAWRPGDPIVLLVHGLCGSAESSYLLGASDRLLRLGLRVVRMNLRGAGSSFGLARGIYHAGRTGDLRAVAEAVAESAPGSPITLLGYSLGGNLVLKLAAEGPEQPAPWLDSVIAVNPPLDLQACSDHLRSGRLRLYDRHFIRTLRVQIDRLHRHFPELGAVDWGGIASLHDFDDQYTAPRNGFDGARDYYRRCSAGPLLRRIDRPGLLVHSADDPFIPLDTFRSFAFPARFDVEISRRGGHVGYVSHGGGTGGRCWLDERLAGWLARHSLRSA